MGRNRGEVFQFSIRAGQLCGSLAYRVLHIDGVEFRPLSARPMHVPKEFVRTVLFHQAREYSSRNRRLNGIGGGPFRIQDHLDLVVQLMHLFKQVIPVEIGESKIDDGDAEGLLTNLLQRFGHRGGAGDTKAFFPKNLGEQLPLGYVILNDQDLCESLDRHNIGPRANRFATCIHCTGPRFRFHGDRPADRSAKETTVPRGPPLWTGVISLGYSIFSEKCL